VIKSGQRVFSNVGAFNVYTALEAKEDAYVVVREYGNQPLDLNFKRKQMTSERFFREFHVDEARDAIIEFSR